MRKLTLSADEAVIRKAKKLARQNRTSISAMFERLVRMMTAPREPSRPIGPIARKATGIIALPKGKTARQVLEESLADKYGLDR